MIHFLLVPFAFFQGAAKVRFQGGSSIPIFVGGKWTYLDFPSSMLRTSFKKIYSPKWWEFMNFQISGWFFSIPVNIQANIPPEVWYCFQVYFGDPVIPNLSTPVALDV